MSKKQIGIGASSAGGADTFSSRGQVSPRPEPDGHGELLEALRAGRMVSFEWDLTTDTVVRSANADELFGPNGTRDTGREFFSHVHPKDREAISKVIQSMSPANPDYTGTFRYTRPSDGRELVLENTGRAEFDGAGKMIRFRALARDVTEQKRAEMREERLRTLLDHNPSLVFMKDEAGRYVYLNEAYEKQFVHSKDWPGKTDFDFWPKESAELFQADDAEVLRCNQVKQFVEDSRDLTGKRYCWLCYKFPFTDSDGKRYVGGVGINATGQAEAEEALRRSEGLLAWQKTAVEMALRGEPLETSLGALAQGGVECFEPDTRVAFYRANGGGTTVRHVVGMPRAYAEKVDGFEISSGALACGLATHSGQAVLTRDVREEPLWKPWLGLAEEFDYRGCWSFPIHTCGGRFVGTLAVYWRQPREASAEDLKVAGILTESAAIIMAWDAGERERKRGEAAVRESEERYRALFKHMLDGFAYCQMLYENGLPKDFVYLSVNDSFARLTGLKNVVGKRISEVIPGIHQSNPELLQIYGRVASSGQAERFETWVESLGIWFLISVYCPQKEHFVAVFDNITERKRAEEALQRSEELLRAVTDNSADAIYVKDDRSRWLLANPALLRIVHRKSPEVLGKTDAEIYADPSIGAAILANDALVMQRGQPEAFEERAETPAGVRLFLSTKAPWHDAEGRIIGVIGISRDITERKRAEEALRGSEERLSGLYAAMNDGLAMHEMVYDAAGQASDYRLLDVNPAFERITGVRRERAVGALASELYGTGAPPYLDLYARVVSSGQPETFETDFPPMDKSFRISVFSPGQGRFATVFADITARKRAGEELRRSRDRFELFSRTVSRLLTASEPQKIIEELCNEVRVFLGCAVFFNFLVEPQARRLRLNTCGGVEPRLARKVEGLELGESLCGSSAQGGHRVVAEDVSRSSDPRAAFVRKLGIRAYACHPLLGTSGEAFGTVSFGADNRDAFSTEDLELMKAVADHVAVALLRRRGEEAVRLAKEELAQQNARLEELVRQRTAKLQEMVGELEHFSYTITHDMKSPLRAMRGFAEMASLRCEDGAHGEAKEFLGRISASAERMDLLIRDALNYSRSVRQELPVEDVDVGALLRGMLDSYPEFQPGKAQIRVEGELPVVLANEAGLTQVFSNLLVNAVKFVKAGEKPDVRVWASSVLAHGHDSAWVRIWVEDKGIGISKEMLPRLFDMFSRGSKEYEGTGIGLALVRKVVQRMGGKVGVESEEGKGSRFWIELKRGEAKESGGQVALSPRAAEESGAVLYVEDEEGDQMFMERVFKGKGLAGRLQMVGDGRGAIDYLSGAGKYADREKYPVPSLVLLDLNLPQVPGFEVLKWMRNNPDFARTPVVVFSSSTREDDRVKAKELGADEFVAKPSSGLKFAEVVEGLQERWLGRRTAES